LIDAAVTGLVGLLTGKRGLIGDGNILKIRLATLGINLLKYFFQIKSFHPSR
jgi:hypothetical protein